MNCPIQDKISYYASGLLGAQESKELEFHLSECAVCRAKQDEMSRALEGLAPASLEFDDPAFAKDVMTLIELGRSNAIDADNWMRPSRRKVVAALAACVAAACVAIVMAVSLADKSAHEDPGGFTARGGTTNQADRWTSLTVYRADANGYRPVKESIASTDGIAFAYTNAGPNPYSYLMVFAVDNRGLVFWYYPDYQTNSDNPASMAIGSTEGRTRLPDEIRHDLMSGPLRVFALFTRFPLRISEVEKRIAKALKQRDTLAEQFDLSFADASTQSILLTVESRSADEPR